MELYPYPVGVEWGGCVARLREERGKRARVRGESDGGMGYTCGVISMYLWEAWDGVAIARERWG